MTSPSSVTDSNLSFRPWIASETTSVCSSAVSSVTAGVSSAASSVVPVASSVVSSTVSSSGANSAARKEDELAGVGLSFYAQIYVLKVPIAELARFHRFDYCRSLFAACACAPFSL